jgi:hypothetical protein
MHDAYLAKTLEARIAHAILIEDEAWKIVALQWLKRRMGSSVPAASVV